MAPNAREKELERQAFYRQLGETAKLSHTFVNPRTSNGQNHVNSSSSQFASPAARHTAPPMAPHPMRLGPETINHAINNLTAEMATLPKPDTSYGYLHHPQPQPQAPTPPRPPPSEHLYWSSQPPQSTYDAHSFASGHEAREWEQPQRGMQFTPRDIQSFIAAEVQRHIGHTHQPPQPPQAQGMSAEDRTALLVYAEQCKAEADAARDFLRTAQTKADSAIKHQSQMAKTIADLERKQADADKALNNEREANSHLRRRLDDVETKTRKELEDTKKRFNTAINEKHNLNERLSLATVEKEKSQDKVKMMRFDNKALDAQNAELRGQKTSLERQNSALTHQKDDIARQLVTVEAQLRQALHDNGQLKQEYRDLQQQLDRLRERVATTNLVESPFNTKSPLQSSPNQPTNTSPAAKLAQGLHELQAASCANDPYQDLGSAFQ